MLTNLRLQTASTATQDDGEVEAATASSSCCIGCFRLMPSPPESPPEDNNATDDTAEAEPDLLCASCILHFAGKSSKSPAVQPVGDGCGALSPLPKLSLLVKAEAKCQDQLELLRSQQEVLRQQRESLQATKRAKEEALAAERELARQRRKHFMMIQERRKREEELKFQLLQAEELTSRSEQDNNTDKPKKKKPKPPKTDVLQRQKTEISAETITIDASLPQATDSTPKSAATPLSTNNDSANTADTQAKSFSDRRKQMMACYSQDLSPLIDGRKPRRLPFPKPVAAVVPSNMIKRRQTPDNNAMTTTSTNQRNKSLQIVRKQYKKQPPKMTKLHPLEEQKQFIKTRPQQHTNNQFESFTYRGDNQYFRRLTDHSVALTAEIKPVSWAYELTKDVLPQDDQSEGIVTSAHLHSLKTAQDESGPQFTMFPLQHQLPTPTFPTPKPEPPALDSTRPPRWEYSAERLSSLLEKYNVSVTTATATSSAPKL